MNLIVCKTKHYTTVLLEEDIDIFVGNRKYNDICNRIYDVLINEKGNMYQIAYLHRIYHSIKNKVHNNRNHSLQMNDPSLTYTIDINYKIKNS